MLQRLQTLPREARDTLFLLGVIAWVILPQLDRLPWWCSAMAGAVLVWRGVLAWGSRPLPSRWWLLALLALATAGTWFSYRTLLGRDAGVTFIVVLLALKTLEMRARRDAFVIFFLGFFTMLSNFFFSQSLLTAGAMVIALLGLLTALVNSHMPVGRPPLMLAAKTAGWMALLGRDGAINATLQGLGLVGEEGRGVPQILEMGTMTRLDCALGTTGLMRQALSLALNHTAQREAFGKRLIEQPLCLPDL